MSSLNPGYHSCSDSVASLSNNEPSYALIWQLCVLLTLLSFWLSFALLLQHYLLLTLYIPSSWLYLSHFFASLVFLCSFDSVLCLFHEVSLFFAGQFLEGVLGPSFWFSGFHNTRYNSVSTSSLTKMIAYCRFHLRLKIAWATAHVLYCN